MSRAWRAAMLLLLAASRADAAAVDALLRAALEEGRPVESVFGNQAVVAVPLPGQPCPTVGVIYRGGRGHGGPRIDNFRVCPGSDPEALHEVSPALSDEPQFRQLVKMAIRQALRYGHQVSDWGGYRVETHRLSPVDAQGCGDVETVVASMGFLVSYHVGRLCP